MDRYYYSETIGKLYVGVRLYDADIEITENDFHTLLGKDIVVINGVVLERELTLQEKQKAISDAIQEHLDSKAMEYRYDDMKSARSYAGFINAFQQEATKLGQWASECWVYAGQVEQEVIAGTRPLPTPESIILELPVFQP